ncbi:MAG TPA: protein-L-isoaspartate(D-aspartate) O-methyltransferase [Rickettsiales bacterium]|nr:protein-L-isoaspartate(D-aspartate) O-methyltransferase [Rickettsiales bacterium]
MKDDEFLQQRQNLVEIIKEHKINDKAVLNAILKVKRHLFIAENIQHLAYEDSPLKIGYGQTISQPFIVAYMTQNLELTKDAKVLEIGTGSGYQSAILAEICKYVYTIEAVSELGLKAKKLLSELGYKNIEFKIATNHKSWIENAPFDAIIATAADKKIPQTLLEQLKIGAILVMPIEKNFGEQILVKVRKENENEYKVEELLPVRFVPMIGENL